MPEYHPTPITYLPQGADYRGDPGPGQSGLAPASQPPPVQLDHLHDRMLELERILEGEPHIVQQTAGAVGLEQGRADPLRPVFPMPVRQGIVMAAGSTVIVEFPLRTRTLEIFNTSGALITRELNAQAGPGSMPIPNQTGRSEDVYIDRVGIYVVNATTINDNQQTNVVKLEAGY